MVSKFEKFSERTRMVISAAQEEAQRFGHSYIGTEHILLGIIEEKEGVAIRVLHNLGVDVAKIRSVLVLKMESSRGVVSEGLVVNPEGRKVIEFAVDEARQLEHSHIGTEHLLVAILREGTGIAAKVLEDLGVTVEKVRSETKRVVQPSQKAAQVPVRFSREEELDRMIANTKATLVFLEEEKAKLAADE